MRQLPDRTTPGFTLLPALLQRRMPARFLAALVLFLPAALAAGEWKTVLESDTLLVQERAYHGPRCRWTAGIFS